MLGFSLIIISIALTKPFYIEANYAADCTTPNNEPGSCMPIMSCRRAFYMFREIQHGRNLQNFQFLKDSHCGSAGNVAFVCCPKDEIQMNSEVIEHLKKIDCGIMDRNKVSHGYNANLYDFRWMVLLKYEGNNPFLCDGTLIDEWHVLTAAHCFDETKLPVAVRVGEYNISSPIDCAGFGGEETCLEPAEDIPIKDFTIHQNYISGDINYDIALIRLEKPVKCNIGISPICLPIINTDLPENFTISGWGGTENNIESNVLQFAFVPKRTRKFCMENFPRGNFNDGHICAGGKHLQDICKGDSGGPLFAQTLYVKDQRAVQFGVVSMGKKTDKCGSKNFPAIYTNVVHYMQWITDHLVVSKKENNSNCYLQ